MHFQHQWHDGSKRYMFYMSGRDSELSNGLNLGFTDVFPSNETLNDGEKNNVIKNSDLVICSISAIHVYTSGRFVSRTAFEFVIGGKAAPGRSLPFTQPPEGRLSWKCPVLTHSRAFPPAVWRRLPSC
jgi:hypothetical protein